MASREIVEKVIFKLSAVLPDRKLLAEAIDVYAEMLDPLNDDVLVETTKELLKKCRFFPTIAEILETAEPIIKRKQLLLDVVNCDSYIVCGECTVYHNCKFNGSETKCKMVINRNGGC